MSAVDVMRAEVDDTAGTAAALWALPDGWAWSPLGKLDEILRKLKELNTIGDDVDMVLDTEASDAARLKQSILNSAFEGRLVPQDPADEPASALLERLKAAPAAATARRTRRRA